MGHCELGSDEYKERTRYIVMHKVYSGMKQRCNNPNRPNYASYGGRGITVCAEWFCFAIFYEDMKEGWEEGVQLDRLDNDKGYCKDNCRWGTHAINCQNRRNSALTPELVKQIKELFAAGQLTQKAIAEQLGVKVGRVHHVVTGKHWKEL